MTRLNQSRRQKIGYVYKPQVVNNVSYQPIQRQMSIVQEQAFDQNMTGEGLADTIRGIVKHREEILRLGKSAVDMAGDVFTEKPKNVKDIYEAGERAYKRRDEISDMVKQGSRLVKDIKEGRGLSVAGGSRGSIQPSVGGGLSVAGGGLSVAGGGLSVAGGAIDIRGNQVEEILPGDELKKKLLKKMVREKKMKALGDRKKTSPIKAGMDGGSLVLAGASSGQSRSKTYPKMKGYKLNPRPLVGAGLNVPKMIMYMKNNVIPFLKKEGLLPHQVKNTENLKKLVGIKVKKAIKEGLKDPEKIIDRVLALMKPILSKGGALKLAGQGDWRVSVGRVGAKLLAGIFRLGNPDSIIAKGFDKLAVAGKGCCSMKKHSRTKKHKQEGGFIISGLIALGSAIAAAASAAAATTVVGGVTVGTLAGAALTGASTAAGAAVVKKIAGDGLPQMKQKIKKIAEQTKITIKEMSMEDKKKLKEAITKFNKNRTKAGAIQFAKSIAPIALKLTAKKLKPKIVKVFKDKGLPIKGSGLSPAGGALVLAGRGEKKFKNEFVKNLVKNLGKMKK